MSEDPSLREKLHSLSRVIRYRPGAVVALVVLSIFAAVFEAVGLSFLLPIIEQARGDGSDPSGISALFARLYETLHVPFTLEYIVLGVALVMVVRYALTFLAAWLREALWTNYVHHLRTETFTLALDARISYFDTRGSDDILNIIVTETVYSGRVIKRIVKILQEGFLSLMYLAIALFVAPGLTLVTAVSLGAVTVFVRTVVESGQDIGDRVADANEDVQSAVQGGTQGIRDVKLFGLSDELSENFHDAVDQYTEQSISLYRNQAAIENFYELVTAVILFGLIYGALRFTSISLGELAIFLFAMFRLAPRVSSLTTWIYRVEGTLPHLIRTHRFIDDLESETDDTGEGRPAPESVNEVVADDISFAYDQEEQVLEDVSFEVSKDEFIAFVGPSGAGKSTIASLLARMYDPDEGEIRADGTSIEEFSVDDWRTRVSVVRQDPYIFNDTLWYNITIGDREASRSEVERACEIAQVTEFLDDLPNGFDTGLGDDGVRLSGGQRQRVALARALLKDAELLVLDEATSDLDSNIERDVHDAIESMDRDYAMVIIAHRLSTVLNADRIYTLEDGRIEESGPHDRLLAQGGTYADLYATQTNDA